MIDLTKEVIRCYSKYVFLDVVGFSKRSAEAQSEIVQSLNEMVLHILNSYELTSQGERILIPTGDGMCIALSGTDVSYDAHIKIALDILKSIDQYNKVTQEESRQFQVRIGINQNTDILVTDINGKDNVAGAGINLASRIMDKADGGQILVSQAVFHELEPSEIYMNKFKSFTATGKHNITFLVHQYIGDNHAGLNVEVPSVFMARKTERKKLSEQTAHYFAQAILHRQDILQIKAKDSIYWDSAVIVLLRLLADDSYRLSKSTEFDDTPTLHTEGAGKKTFEEQYLYYKSQDTWVLHDAEDHIVHGRIDNEGLELAQFSGFFEYGDYERHYEFVNEKGIDKLKQEWPAIWGKYELDKYI